ncbi:MAG: hypothetical protein L0Y44_05075 [Phycisphaerales bacterium]|nr:hypothetical protein [Phycisphaerales bacterium]MCI0630010.1 hypothetical protein [Phycisphaerales bacterium]MCI0675018.1 hypothetical protein [Phycisphaerales bacterium]
MNNQRNGGMTAIGILNIVFGGIGTLLSLLAVLGGGLLAAFGTAAQSQGATNAAGATATGGLVMVVGFVLLLCWLGLMVGGIGVMKLAPWGRTFSMWCGLVIALLNVYALVTGGFNPFTAVCLLYGGIVFAMFNTPAWKAAFSGQPAHGSHGSQSSEYRRAA